MTRVCIKLTAEGQSFEVSSDILAKSSFYFRAALQSGMSESQTNHFVFPNFTGHQLDMIIRFFRSELSVWNDSHILSDNGLICPEYIKLTEALELIDAADYLQMPSLVQTCVNRISSILNILFQTESIQHHLFHDCNIFSLFLSEFTKIIQYNISLLKKMFSDYVLGNPDLVLKSSPFDPHLLPQIISLTIAYLSSSRISISTEDTILDLVIDWINDLHCTHYLNALVMKEFMHCIRPGLLSPKGRIHLLQFWQTQYPDFEWFDFVTVHRMRKFFESMPMGGIFPHCHPLSAPQSPERYLLTPRADSVCLLSLAPNRSNLLEFWLFNLHNGSYHNCPIPSSCLNVLDLDYFGTDNLDRRIYLCPLSASSDLNQSTIFVLSFDQSSRVLNGFLWCLATGEGRVIPRLFLNTTERTFSSIGSCFHSRRISLATLSTGLHLYYVRSSSKVTWLCLFHFDISTWSWIELEPYSLSHHQDGIMLFTPIEQLNANPPNDWLYANIEMAYSGAQNSYNPCHGLHQTSALRSIFFRFCPCSITNKVKVENLPTAPFLIRIYRLLVIDMGKDQNSEAQTYLFPMGTCSRDQVATQYYYDTQLRQWLRWSSCEESTNPETNSHSNLTINLCSKILGFRGLVCATHLLGCANKSKSIEDPFFLVDRIRNHDSHSRVLHSVDDDKLLRIEKYKTSLVLVGKPDQNKQISSGIWFHIPAPKGPPNMDVFDWKKPNLIIPTAVTQTLGQFSSPALVVLANWTRMVRFSDLVQFQSSNRTDPLCSSRQIRTTNGSCSFGNSHTESVSHPNVGIDQFSGSGNVSNALWSNDSD